MLLLLGMRNELISLDHERYWELVRTTLGSVLDSDRTVEELRRDVGRRPAAEQLLFYHTEPLDVASSIAQVHPGEDDLRAYIALRAQAYDIVDDDV